MSWDFSALSDIGLLPRLALLLILMAIVSVIDWWRHPESPMKWQEYAFLLAVGLAGGLLGMGNNQITSAISPQYFFLGKGIPFDANFSHEVTLLGFHAGLFVGFVVGGAYLLANNPSPQYPRLAWSRLSWYGLRPVVAGIVLAPIGGVLMLLSDPEDMATTMCKDLIPAQIESFLFVQGSHMGIYMGAMLGTISGLWAIRRHRHQPSTASAPSATPVSSSPAATPSDAEAAGATPAGL